ncbi:MAG: O-antigen ligase family protein [Acidobacteriota bacterium]|nr:O-antigen ligase family protein [Acidobacteriota bacterium]
MTFILAALYVAFSLLSPSVLPEAIWSLHVNIILGIAVLLVSIPQIVESKLGTLPDSYLVLALLMVATVSIFRLGFSQIPATFMGFLPILIVYYFVLIACRRLVHLKVLTYILLLVAFYIFAQGAMADHAHNALSPYLIAEGEGEKMVFRYRGIGVLSDPNDVAQFYVTLIPMLFLRWKKNSYFLNFVFTLLPAGVLIAGMYFTHSRGGAIALVALILFGFKDKLGIVKSSVLAAAMFVGMMALNISGGRGMNDDDGGRVAAWVTGLELFKAHPLLGVGINQFSEYNDTGHTAHNSYVLCLAEIGLFGYFCWMGTIVSNLKDLSAISRLKTQREKEKEGARTANPMPESMRVSSPAPALEFAFQPGQLQPAAFARPAYAGAELQGSHAGGDGAWAGSPRIGSMAPSPEDSESDLIYAARIMRIAFVGLLTSAFFLSRSFSMVFYLVLGMSAALRLIYDKRHPEMTHPFGKLLRAVTVTIVLSVVFLYLFVRIRGLH